WGSGHDEAGPCGRVGEWVTKTTGGTRRSGGGKRDEDDQESGLGAVDRADARRGRVGWVCGLHSARGGAAGAGTAGSFAAAERAAARGSFRPRDGPDSEYGGRSGALPALPDHS